MGTPLRVAIVGGHGKVARKLIPMLSARGHEVVALVRSIDQMAPLTLLGAAARRIDLEAAEPAELAADLGGCQAVVFAAGAGADGNIDRKRTVDLEGALKTIEAAKLRGIRRIVQVSAARVDQDPDSERGPVWAAYVYAKREADAALRESGLDWTILRPGTLTDGPGTGRITLDHEVHHAPIPRVDVAATIAAVLDQPESIGHQWELVTGPTPLREAITAAAAAR